MDFSIPETWFPRTVICFAPRGVGAPSPTLGAQNYPKATFD